VEEVFEGGEPEDEGGEGLEELEVPNTIFPGFNYETLVLSKYLTAVEALICDPAVAREIEGERRVAITNPIQLEGDRDWDVSDLYAHLGGIADACGIAGEVKRPAVLNAIAVFCFVDSGATIGYIDVDMPEEWGTLESVPTDEPPIADEPGE
jgi:hypothetical protein